MREEALALAAAVEDPAQKLNLLREYLQAYTLRSLHENEAFGSLAFVGGTALRFLENLPRFSEDLDFSVISREKYTPKRWLKKVKQDLQLAGFECRLTWNERKTVNVSWIRISQLLKQAGLSHREDQNLAIKLEIDTCPPEGAEIVRTIVNRNLTFVVSHYGLTSLMAGKIHALITRPYPKGRDWFDLIWYRGHRPPIDPKIDLLQNALDQTQGKGTYQASRWHTYVRNNLATLDVEKLADDVRVFLERPEDRKLLTKENLDTLLR